MGKRGHMFSDHALDSSKSVISNWCAFIEHILIKQLPTKPPSLLLVHINPKQIMIGVTISANLRPLFST